MVEEWKCRKDVQEYVINYNKKCYYEETSSALEINEFENGLSPIPFDYKIILQAINKFGVATHHLPSDPSLNLLSSWLKLPNKRYACPPCRKTFAHVTTHIRDVHLGLINRNERTKKPQPENERTCQICKKLLCSRAGLSLHIGLCDPNRKEVFKCPECQKQFNLKNNLKIHINAQHTKRRSYPCEICNRILFSSSARRGHIITYHSAKQFQCPFCSKSFLRNYNLTHHKRTHTEHIEKNFSCTVCNKKFISKSLLNTHSNIHKPESERRTLKCSICPKRFMSRGALTNHIYTHTGERPYKCKFCGDSFKVGSHLAQHYLKHTQEKPYDCLECGKGFALKHHLDKHLKTHLVKRRK